MSLNTAKLEKLKDIGNGAQQARCPACWEAGQDKSGNHLRIYPDGKFGCALHPGDHAHRQRIFALAGTDTPVVRRKLAPAVPAEPVPASLDAARLLGRWQADTTRQRVDHLARLLSVLPMSLVALRAAWTHRHGAWAFPMSDGQGNIVGLRLRSEIGHKWAVTGSRSGIFVPQLQPHDVALICEGITDTAAALSLGFFALGRPSCSSGLPEIKTTCLRLGIRRAIMVADHDPAGLVNLHADAARLGLPVKTFVPPSKDLRQLIELGATHATMDAMLNNLKWTTTT